TPETSARSVSSLDRTVWWLSANQRGGSCATRQSGNAQIGDTAGDHYPLDLRSAFEDRVAHLAPKTSAHTSAEQPGFGRRVRRIRRVVVSCRDESRDGCNRRWAVVRGSVRECGAEHLGPQVGNKVVAATVEDLQRDRVVCLPRGNGNLSIALTVPHLDRNELRYR